MTDLFSSSGAVLSECGTYRYRLSRRWAEGPTCLFIMLNPSTADAEEDDPTIRRCMGFAKREGGGGLEVINLFTLRATDPADLSRHPYPHGPEAVRHAVEAVTAAKGPVICAWGADPAAQSAAPDMLNLVRAAGHQPLCLGMTKAGAPRHPLYLRADAALAPYPPKEA